MAFPVHSQGITIAFPLPILFQARNMPVVPSVSLHVNERSWCNYCFKPIKEYSDSRAEHIVIIDGITWRCHRHPRRIPCVFISHCSLHPMFSSHPSPGGLAFRRTAAAPAPRVVTQGGDVGSDGQRCVALRAWALRALDKMLFFSENCEVFSVCK